MVVLLLLLALEFVCLGLLALVRFRAAGLVLIDLQLQRLLVVLGVALTILPKVLLFTHVTSAKPFRVATFAASSCLSCGADIQAASSAVRHD